MECLPHRTSTRYASDFRIADVGFFDGRVASTTKKRKLWWTYWTAYVRPLGLDPYLQGVTYHLQVRSLSGFVGRVRTGYYGRNRQITASSVTSTLTAIGMTIALAYGNNPTKMAGAQHKMIPRLAQMLSGFCNNDPPTIKKLPVEIDIPECIALCSLRPTATVRDQVTTDLILVAFYYLLRVGEYMMKSTQNNAKRTVQFRLQDVTFFTTDN